MLDKFIFENHLGQRFDGLSNGVYLNYSDLRDYSWNYDVINNRISRFNRTITKRTLPLVVYCKSDDDAITVKNHLHDLAEADIYAKLPGKIFVGDYYTTGFITGSKKANYLIRKKYCKIDLSFTSDNPAWYKDRVYTFMPHTGSEFISGGGADYPYDYSYDYALSVNGRQIMCDTAGKSEFKIRIYGEATDPEITIGKNTYGIKGTINKGESLLIDSTNKTITLTTALGNKFNWFDKRLRDSYIFEPIASGMNTVTWGGSFGFDLTVIEERSEPKWT